MKFFKNLRAKKYKNNYKTLLEVKDSLDDISLKISILNDRIISYKKNLSLSFDKINNYITKISVAYKKNNFSLCKKGFIKYYKETLIYNTSTKIYKQLESSCITLTDDLNDLQNLYSSIEESYYQQNTHNSFFSSNSTEILITNFSKKISEMDALISTLYSFVPNKQSTLQDIDEETLFKNNDEFLEAFSKFLKECII